MRVLIVDDDNLAQELLANFLRAQGYQPFIAGDGQAALDILDREAISVVISDWEMPGMDGLELCRRIRAGAVDRYVFTILLTARDSAADLLAGMSAGADEFLTKPFKPEELRVRLAVAERVTSLETRDLTIFALAKLAESRDPETGAHLERVRAYCRLLALNMAKQPKHAATVTPEFARLMYITSPLHDIGKVGIPDFVLLKPGRLDDREFAIMKTHAALGARTLDAALSQYPKVKFLQMARDIAATHHERWDGQGYPNRLRSTEIPLAGRIMAAADVYDALRSRRVYKGPSTHLAARSIIVEASGRHFDPDVIEAFLACEPEIMATADRLDEEPAEGRGSAAA